MKFVVLVVVVGVVVYVVNKETDVFKKVKDFFSGF